MVQICIKLDGFDICLRNDLSLDMNRLKHLLCMIVMCSIGEQKAINENKTTTMKWYQKKEMKVVGAAVAIGIGLGYSFVVRKSGNDNNMETVLDRKMLSFKQFTKTQREAILDVFMRHTKGDDYVQLDLIQEIDQRLKSNFARYSNEAALRNIIIDTKRPASIQPVDDYFKKFSTAITALAILQRAEEKRDTIESDEEYIEVDEKDFNTENVYFPLLKYAFWHYFHGKDLDKIPVNLKIYVTEERLYKDFFQKVDIVLLYGLDVEYIGVNK